MSINKDIDQTQVKMTAAKWLKWSWGLGVFLVLATNTVNYWIFSVSKNTEQIEYNEGASKRRINHAIEKLEYQLEIKSLNKQLKDCYANNK